MNAPVNKTKRKRHPNHRLAKIHRNYTVEEVTDLFGVHRNTVREWVKRGLPIIDTKRPMLILGQELGIFLKARRTKNKQSCSPGEFYCLRCRAPQVPAENMVDCQILTSTTDNLVGICSCCESLIYRRVNLMKLEKMHGLLNITFVQNPLNME